MAGPGGAAGGTAPWHEHAVLGREPLVAELTAAARGAIRGSGSVALLTGEAGIGKTTVARAVARQVRDDVVVTWGACAADRSAPPFWPWRAVLELEDTAASEPEPVIGAPRFELLTDLRDRVLADPRPRLHVIEDLQWADVASVLLLAQVAAAAGDRTMVVLATVRTGEPLGDSLEEAIEEVRRASAVRALPPLPDDAVEVLIHDAGIDSGSDLASVVRSRAGGNPLFVTELLRGTGAAGAPNGDGTDEVPVRVAELIGHRLARLPTPLAELVVAASVVGSEGDVRTLAAIRGSDVESVVDLLEQGRAARLLDAAPPGRWCFRHDLVRDAVYASVTDAVRARAHAAVLGALDADGTVPPTVLAHHALAAQPLLPAERAVELAAAAGTAALAQHAYEEAVDWFDRALAATTPDLAPRWRAELLVDRGEALRLLGALQASRAAFLDAAEQTDDAALLARAALGYADPGADLGIAYRTEDPVTAPLLERAIAAQPTGPSSTSVLLQTRLAAELYFSDQPERARRLVDDALDEARRLGDTRALGAAGAVAHDAFVVGQAPLTDQLDGSRQLLAWARESGSTPGLLTAHRARAMDLLAAGDLTAMDTEVVSFRRLAEPLRASAFLWWPALWTAMRALLDGRHADAEDAAFAAYAIGEQPFPALALGNLSFLLFFLRREQGRFDEMEQATRDYVASHADIPAIRVAHAFLLAEIGRHDEARGLLGAIATHDLDRLHDRNWPASWFQLARAAALVGDRELAATLLEPHHVPSERCVTVSLATVCLGSADLAAAWLHHAVGDLDAADRRYAAAADANAGLGARSWLAQARCDRAALLLDRGRTGDADRARELVAQATDAASVIGLGSITAELDELHRRLEATGEPTVAPVGQARSTFRRAGSVWELEFAGRRAQVPDARGLRDLAFLLARPGEAVSVLELQGDGAPAADAARGAPTLDERARREIRERLRDLDAAVAEAEADHDLERESRAREERQLLAEAVARDLGLGGRSRLVGDPVERARKTVSTRIRRTIATVGQAHPELGRHLERSIDTGAWCAYRPAEPERWLTS